VEADFMSDVLELSVIVDGHAYDFTDLTTYFIEAIDGLGLPAVERYWDRAPGQDGDTDRGFTLMPRFIDFIFGVEADDPGDFWDQRNLLRAILRPGPEVIWFRFTKPNDDVRQIDLVFYDGLRGSFSRQGKIGLVQRDSVTLKASGLFYDPVPVGWLFGINAGSSGWDVPMPVPVDVGSSAIDETRPLSYDGEWDEFPLIELTGPMTNPVVTNVGPGLVLDFTGATISAGHKRIIDLTWGNKTIVDHLGVNKIDDLVIADSDLGDWRLVAAQGLLPPHTNTIGFSGSGLTSASQFKIIYYDQFLGI
jgi:hypothetical protein